MRRLVVALFLVCALTTTRSEDNAPLRIGVLEYGTVNWELDVIRRHALAASEGIVLEVVPLASKEASSVALQAGAVDVIVTDWLWVSRQRHNGADFTFVPHSLAAGGLMVDPASGIRGIEDLRGRRVGVAGGPEDKSWLLLRAYALREFEQDPALVAEPAFGAPPLLNELVKGGELPAVLNYWHYNARLAAAGMEKLVDVEDILPALGIERRPPFLGWAFSESFAENSSDAVPAFLRASLAAKQLLRDSDAEWQQLRPLMHADSDADFVALRDAYRDGIPGSYSNADIVAARRAYAVMAGVAGETLTGGEAELAPGTFWDGFRF